MGDQQKETKGKKRQFRWTSMSTMALQILADEAMKGNKPSTTFKPASFIRVAQEVSEKFKESCLSKHVENHLRTIKKEWKIIVTLKDKSGFGWDENMKMITTDQHVYDEEVAAQPSHGKFLNKKIAMYDEMSIVVGKDIATGVYAKSHSNVDIDETIDVEDIVHDDDISMYEEMPTPKGFATNSKKRSHRKRSRAIDDGSDEKMYEHLSNLASAIQEFGTSARKAQKIFVDNLFKEVMNVEGYDQFDLSRAFDYLVEHKSTVTTFLVKTPQLKKFWVDNFLGK